MGEIADDVVETMHLIYTNKDGEVKSIERDFLSFDAAEKWLESIGATYWEIGIKD